MRGICYNFNFQLCLLARSILSLMNRHKLMKFFISLSLSHLSCTHTHSAFPGSWHSTTELKGFVLYLYISVSPYLVFGKEEAGKTHRDAEKHTGYTQETAYCLGTVAQCILTVNCSFPPCVCLHKDRNLLKIFSHIFEAVIHMSVPVLHFGNTLSDERLLLCWFALDTGTDLKQGNKKTT